MVADKTLKDALMKRLGIAPATLYAKAENIRKIMDMDVDEAIYMFALESGIRLKRYLDNNTVNRIRELHVKYASLVRAPVERAPTSTSRRKSADHSSVIKMPNGAELDDPLLPDHIKQDAKRMAAIYPWFYYLENSIRSFICVAMHKYEGEDWWSRVKPSLQRKVEGRKNRENKNEWHQKRGDREVDYLDFDELRQLINDKTRSALVKDRILPKGNWLDMLMDEVYESRCVIAHMNPLTKDNIDAVKVKVKQWNKQIKGKYKELQQ